MKTEEQVRDWLQWAKEHRDGLSPQDTVGEVLSEGIIETLKWVLEEES